MKLKLEIAVCGLLSWTVNHLKSKDLANLLIWESNIWQPNPGHNWLKNGINIWPPAPHWQWKDLNSSFALKLWISSSKPHISRRRAKVHNGIWAIASILRKGVHVCACVVFSCTKNSGATNMGTRLLKCHGSWESQQSLVMRNKSSGEEETACKSL